MRVSAAMPLRRAGSTPILARFISTAWPTAPASARNCSRCIRVGRLGDPRDVGNLAVWLASDESTFVTGQIFVIDGGRTKKLPLPIS